MADEQPLFLRPGCSRVGDMALCILLGGVLGFALSLAYIHVGNPAIRTSEIRIDGPDGYLLLRPDGLTMYGEDYSQATLLFKNADGQSPPVLEIRDKGGEVKFTSAK